MSIIRLKSLHPITEFSPSWNIPIYQSLWEDLDSLESVSNWLVANEKKILDLPVSHDGDTGLSNDHVTTRFGTYNLFNFVDDCPELADLLKFLQYSYINFIREEQGEVRDLAIVCWFNLLRSGDKIKEHSHGAGNDVYLSGNFHLDNYKTYTYYLSPYDKDCVYSFPNKKGNLTLFPTYLVHGATEFKEENERLSIAFDLRLSYNINNSKLQSIPFMNREIFESL